MDRDDTDAGEVLVVVHASAPRRWMGIVALAGLGTLLAALAIGTPMAFLWRLVFLAGAAGAIAGAAAMHRATQAVLELTREELRERGGLVLARIEEVERVDRSMFAMKPSNGFLLKLSRPQTRVWRPGLWWRLGRRVAVGGVTAGAQTRPMADIIAALKSGQI
ncbi:hypothetical protein [Roseivivax sediminis]|uniref:Uncharacterized protein n=1 Tax=Roseivivax sediminis TaxID=936889 RepID=A0A1I1SGE4_9RHOB|nr:hypothetical protein [Roseivivax sediminis]SFD45565.1 hypothetical protein SAMN04515678_101156 [Roseivivax sediminis]